jgi:hypothetical protein
MRFGARLFAALVLAGALGNAARAQLPGVSTAAPGPNSESGSGLTFRPASGYTGPYADRGPGLTYRQTTSSIGPYSERFSSASRPAPTGAGSYSSLRTAGLMSQAGNGRGLGGDATRPDAGRARAAGGGPGAGRPRPRYVRLNIAGNAIQGIVIP